jgi:tRNA A-37 threonylcarbamoyl transferase component Bud32
MGLSRRPARNVESTNLRLFDSNSTTKQRKYFPKRRFPPLHIATAISICFTLDFFFGLAYRLSQNLPNHNALLIRGGKSRETIPKANFTTSCPSLPGRLENITIPKPLVPLSKEQLESQVVKHMILEEHGTTGSKILTCRRDVKLSSEECRGVLKIYRSKSIYRHVKRCLRLLEKSGMTSRILYTDDENKIMVEEDLGSLTMMNSPVPFDYAPQLRRIHCILQEHSIIHRDFNFRNFIVDPSTGYIRIIDFGDAVIWQGSSRNTENFQLRNLENLFSLWWKSYDAQAELDGMVEIADPMIFGDRLWKPPKPKRL